jgi:uncharacterized membrane protein YbhN (UPF0104 family)
MSAVTDESSGEPSPEASATRRYVLLAVKLSVSIILLAVLFSRIDAGDLWSKARTASIGWLGVALLIHILNVLAATWRWHLLLSAQHVDVPARRLLGSYLVASFFNNFLPSNIGGDVIRITDTARAAGSKTLAVTVVLVDRGLGMMALVLIAAVGATAAGQLHPAAIPIWPIWLWAGFLVAVAASVPAVFAPAGFGRLLQPLTVFHPEWVGERIDKLILALGRFRDEPGALAACFAGAIFVQATMVVFYYTVAHALHLSIAFSDIAVIVPISIVVQMLPVSVNGFGVREATFSLYFQRIGQPIESALLMSLVGQAIVILFSLSGAAVYVWRSKHPSKLKAVN